MNTIELKPGIYSVGIVDWNSRSFHGYAINNGTTYNAYLIIDEKITLIDTVKASFSEELIERISEIVDPKSIDYVISNHVEMDHSGSIPAVMKLAKNAVIVTSSPGGKKGLIAHYGDAYQYMEVKTGDTLKLGKRTLTFVTTPMLHWTDNMVTYCPEEKLLFSNDAFGQHYTSNNRFDDEEELERIMYELRHYYANILMPYGQQAKKALAAVKALDIDMIAPSHGIIWRSHIKEAIEAYEYYAEGRTEDYALVIYDTMWHSTEAIARSILEGFSRRGTRAKLLDLGKTPLSDVMTEMLKAKYLAVGCPTLDSYITPNIGAFLTYMKCLSPKNKLGFAFGSYGWSGQSIGIVEQMLKDMGVEIILDPIRITYVPSEKQLKDIEDRVSEIKIM
jgi:flavorubredoxin